MKKEIIRLMIGFRKFRERYFPDGNVENSVYHRLAAAGQTPKTLLIGCSDSRVDPAILTSASPGELFVVRNVANLVPPCEPSAFGFHGTSSALQFAVDRLKVENVIVLGHRQCGGVRALMEGATDRGDGFIGPWMHIAEEARTNTLALYGDADLETQCRHAEMESIKVSIRNLRTFPFVTQAINDRQMNLIGVYFDLEQGQLLEYDEENNKFVQLEI